jgi:transposase-like protein
VTKRGVFKNKSGPVQCYGCKTCRIRFVPRTDFNGVRYRAAIIIGALDLYFKGLSLRKISDHINQQYGMRVTHQTVYRWVLRYLALAKERVKGFVPKVSKVWNADETVQNVRGKYCYQWNLMDNKTRFFLATRLSRHRSATDAEKLVDQGILTAHATPRCLVTDGLASYTAGTSQLKSKRSVKFRHTRSTRLSENNRVERLNNTLRERTKTMRAFNSMKSVQRFADDYRFYYNFIRPHGGLGGQTPAEAAGLRLRLGQSNRWFRLLHS